MGSNTKIAVAFALPLLTMILVTTNASADLMKDGTCGWWSSFWNCYDRGRDSEMDSIVDDVLHPMILNAEKKCPGKIPAIEIRSISDETLMLVQCGSDGPRYLIRSSPNKYGMVEINVEETTLDSVNDYKS